MKTAILVVTATSALALAACAPPYARHPPWAVHLRPIAKLDCPASQGALTRTSQSPDGKACAYAGDNGAQVQMTLVDTPNGPDAALASTEADLKTLLPPPPASDAPKDVESESDTPPAPPPRPGDHKSDNVNIRLPGIMIHAGDEKANISIGGLHIDADDATNTVHMQSGHGFGHRGQFTIDANHGGAVIRATGGGPDVHATLILASDQTGPQGWHVVGYEALGPRSGPIVVATVKSKSDDHDTVFEDVKSLVRKSAAG